MKIQIFISLYAILHSQRYQENLKQMNKYKNFLKKVALPWVTEDMKNLREDTPPSIKRQYTLFKKKIRHQFVDTQKLFEKFEITKEKLRIFDNCSKYIGASSIAKGLINLIHNFENDTFNARIDLRIEELGGIRNYSEKLLTNIEKEIF